MKHESKIISFSCIVSMITSVIIIPSAANAYTPLSYTLTTKALPKCCGNAPLHFKHEC